MSITASRPILKKRFSHQLLNWIRDECGGESMETTRYLRLQWDVTPPTHHHLQLRIRSSRKWQLLPQIPPKYQHKLSQLSTKSKLGKSEDPKQLKISLDKEESGEILRELLKLSSNASEATSEDFSREFLRPPLSGSCKKKKIVVEYGSPNIAKPLHMGHLRSQTIGHFVARICKAAGHPVTTLCFLGDWGTQFGILQAGLKKWSGEELSNCSSISEVVRRMSLSDLLSCYVKSVKEKEASELFFREALKCSAALENKDPIAMDIWRVVREKTVDHLQEFWKSFDMKYTLVQGESDYTVNSQWAQVALAMLQELGLTEVSSDGCTNVILSPDEKFQNLMKIPILKSDGTSLYLLRDIGCALHRHREMNFDHLIYVVDKSQSHHFSALFRILEKLDIQQNDFSPDEWTKRLRHVKFGKVEGMSTRSGNFVLLSQVVETGLQLMQQAREKSVNTRKCSEKGIAETLATSALIVNNLKVRRNKELKFDWTEALRPTGETGVNLQYNHARLFSLGEKAKTVGLVGGAEFDKNCNVEYLMRDPLALALAIQLINYEDSFWSSYAELEPCILLSYLFRLSDKVSKCLKQLPVVSEQDESIASTRLLLFNISRSILRHGLWTLGITALNQI